MDRSPEFEWYVEWSAASCRGLRDSTIERATQDVQATVNAEAVANSRTDWWDLRFDSELGALRIDALLVAQPSMLIEMDPEGSAADELLPLVYDELHGLAGRFLRGEGPAHTLQATALVHEAYVRLSGRDQGFENRLHFFRVAARAMRGVLINHARDRARLKRGGDRARVTLGTAEAAVEAPLTDILDLDAALAELSQKDQELARIVELRFFAGLTIEETAELIGVSAPTVERRWRVARAFLRQHMRGDVGPAP